MNRTLKPLLTALAVVVLSLLLLQSYRNVAAIPQDAKSERGAIEAPEIYLRAVHWFGAAWPINFWNTDLEARVDEDFQRIVEDGFNTVVLVVPWPGFAPDPRSGRLDEVRSARLLGLMRKAHEAGLRVVLRVGYAWDAVDQQAGERLMGLWLNDEFLDGWLEYLESLWQLVEHEPNFEFAFFSWEDLWAVISFAEADDATRLRAAEATGFRDSLIGRYTLNELAEHYRRPFSEWSEVPVPSRKEPAFRLFLDFVNTSWIERFFVPAKQRFPKLSMEIRIDSDPIHDGEELVEWYGHHAAWTLPGADWVTLYWTPSMGGQNVGEVLAPELAAERLEWWLQQVEQHAGAKNIFIGQFLAEDFTPGYEKNGKIARERVPEFLALAAEVLARRSSGYGLWTWTDYGHDAIASPDFYDGLKSWEHAPGVTAHGHALLVPGGHWIRHRISRHEYHAPGGPAEAELCITATPLDGPEARVELRDVLAEQALGALHFDAATQERCLVLAVRGLMELQIDALDAVRIERVTSIGFIQKSGMREIGKQPKPIASSYRALNRSLERRRLDRRPLWPDRWMGTEIDIGFEISPAHRALRLKTFLPENWTAEPTIEVWINGQQIAAVPCLAGVEYRFDLPEVPLDLPLRVRLVSSSTVRIDGDKRELGCVIAELAPVSASSSGLLLN
jgi:hypothetical protein